MTDAAIARFMEANNYTTQDMRGVLALLQTGTDKALQLTHEPVGIREFIESPHFLNAKGAVYPVLMDELEEMASGKYVEVVLTGAIGAGKTTLALYLQAYSVYLISCYINPHQIFGLDPASEIEIIFQSINADLAKEVDFTRFKNMVTKAPYFQQNYMYNKGILSKLLFPNNVVVKPVAGQDTASIGQNVIGGLIDEMNFMNIVAKSKKSIDGGVADQAVDNYNSIATRRQSRFVEVGSTPGVLCLVSSRRYPGQFTDTKEEEAKRQLAETGTTTIYVYDKKVWEIKPHEFEGVEWFSLFVGDDTNDPKILTEEEAEESPYKDHPLVMLIPEIYRSNFIKDMHRSLRDIAGVSTLARTPYFNDGGALTEAFNADNDSILSRTSTDFVQRKLAIRPDYITNPDSPRWVHIDLAVSQDSAGMAMGYVPKFVTMKAGGQHTELMPLIKLDFTLEIKPPKNGEINFAKIRTLLYKLRELGINITWVSFDGFQSVDFQQILRHKGFRTGYVSMDKTIVPYDTTKLAIAEHRLVAPEHPKCVKEFRSLELDVKANNNKGKIDHPPNGSKDISDAVAGVTHGLTTRKEIWISNGIPLVQIPDHIAATSVAVKNPDG